MMEPLMPVGGSLRLATAQDAGLFDAGDAAAFERLTRIASATMNVPVSLITLVGERIVWCKATVGLTLLELPTEGCFCRETIQTDAPMVVQDAMRDPRFAATPVRVEGGIIRYYVGQPIRAPDGKRIGALCVVDVTPGPVPSAAQMQVLRDLACLVTLELQARRAREAGPLSGGRLQSAHQSLLSAYQAKSEFLASLSHELRTPLNAIVGFARLINDKNADLPGCRRHAEEIEAAGQHMLTLVNDVLEFSRLEADGLRLNLAPVALRRPLDEAARMVAAFARSRGLAVRQELLWPDATVRGDALRLKQVLLNLLTNAIRFTPAGGSICARLVADADGAVLIEVEDTGIGIAPQDIAKALTPFGQIVLHGSGPEEGTGLGLPIAKALVERHGGTLTIRSQPGAGTTVTIRLQALALH